MRCILRNMKSKSIHTHSHKERKSRFIVGNIVASFWSWDYESIGGSLDVLGE